MIVISMSLNSLFWYAEMCFFTEEFSLLTEMFPYVIVDKTCGATYVLLIAVVTRDLVDGVSL